MAGTAGLPKRKAPRVSAGLKIGEQDWKSPEVQIPPLSLSSLCGCLLAEIGPTDAQAGPRHSVM